MGDPGPKSTSGDGERRRALAALAFALVGPLAYLAQRLIDHAIGGAPDPLSMIHGGRAVYPFRAATAAFWAGLAAIAVFAATGPRGGAALPHRLARHGIPLVAVTAVVFLVLAWVYP